jgi:site-specific DNA recombinase
VTTPTTRRYRPTRPPTPAAGAPRRVAVYVRRSTDDEHQPFSIDAQLAKLNSYIDSQPGWTLAATFSDDASGATTNRPGLQAALDAAHAGRYDVLLVYRVDRFSRRLTDMMALVEQLDTAGVAFCSATEHFDTSTPMGRMFLQLLGMFAEFERSTIIDRVINGMTAKAGKGKWTGGTRPFGYRVDRDIDRLTPDPHEAPVLREIFGLYVSARLGTRTIANQLNTRGLRNRSGKPWSGHNIGRILANRVYLGEVHFRDIVTTDAHPALIDEEIFAAAQRLRDARGDKQTQRAGSDSDYHCTGLITCPRCGHKYVGTSARGKTRRYRYYTCFSRTRYGAAGCPAGRIDADDLDTAVLQAVAHTFTSRTQLLADVVARARQRHHDSHAHRRAELATVEAEITTARAAIERYLTAFENGTMNDTTCVHASPPSKPKSSSSSHAVRSWSISSAPNRPHPARTSWTGCGVGSATSSPPAHPHSARNSSRPWSPPSASTATRSIRSSVSHKRRNPRRHDLDEGTRATVSHNGAVGGADGTRTRDRSIMSRLL